MVWRSCGFSVTLRWSAERYQSEHRWGPRGVRPRPPPENGHEPRRSVRTASPSCAVSRARFSRRAGGAAPRATWLLGRPATPAASDRPGGLGGQAGRDGARLRPGWARGPLSLLRPSRSDPGFSPQKAIPGPALCPLAPHDTPRQTCALRPRRVVPGRPRPRGSCLPPSRPLRPRTGLEQLDSTHDPGGPARQGRQDGVARQAEVPKDRPSVANASPGCRPRGPLGPLLHGLCPRA